MLFVEQCEHRFAQDPASEWTAGNPWVQKYSPVGQPCVSGSVDIPTVDLTWSCGLQIDGPLDCNAKGTDVVVSHGLHALTLRTTMSQETTMRPRMCVQPAVQLCDEHPRQKTMLLALHAGVL